LAESPRDKLGDVERDHIEAAIRSAFAGVQLGSGISLRQTQVISDYGRGYTRAEFEALPESEVTDDWAQIPDDELAQDFIVAHLDADGLRYYLPALMLWLLHHYDDEDRVISGADMTSIFTMAALAPDPRFEESYRGKYDSFSADQRAAVASYVEALPRLVELDDRDAAAVARSIDHLWAPFLPRP